MFQTFCPLTIHSSPSRRRECPTRRGRNRPRLGEELTPLLLTGEHRTQETLLHLLAAMGRDRRTGKMHEEGARFGRGRAGLTQTLLDQLVQFRPRRQATMALGKVHPRQPGIEARATERVLSVAVGSWAAAAASSAALTLEVSASVETGASARSVIPTVSRQSAVGDKPVKTHRRARRRSAERSPSPARSARLPHPVDLQDRLGQRRRDHAAREGPLRIDGIDQHWRRLVAEPADEGVDQPALQRLPQLPPGAPWSEARRLKPRYDDRAQRDDRAHRRSDRPPLHRQLARAIEERWQTCWDEHRTFVAPTRRSEPSPTPSAASTTSSSCSTCSPTRRGRGCTSGTPRGTRRPTSFARYQRMKGKNVLHPMGYDAFGLPAEQYAVQTGVHPAITTREAIDTYRRQLKRFGFSYDWSRDRDDRPRLLPLDAVDLSPRVYAWYDPSRPRPVTD